MAADGLLLLGAPDDPHAAFADDLDQRVFAADDFAGAAAFVVAGRARLLRRAIEHAGGGVGGEQLLDEAA